MWLHAVRESGYRVHMTFLSLPDLDAAVARVAERVRRGGHDVPEDVIRRRYRAGLRNFFGVYVDAVDSWQLYDNSRPSLPRLIASRAPGAEPTILDAPSMAALERSR